MWEISDYNGFKVFFVDMKTKTIGLSFLLCSFLALGLFADTQKNIVDIRLLFDEQQLLRQNCFGANNNLLYPPFTYSQPDFANKYIEAHRPFFKYPCGTGANYLNPLTGYSEPRDITAKSKKKTENKKREDPLEFFRFIKKTNATYSLVMNLCTVSLEDNKRWLKSLAARGIVPEYFELGNELYFRSYSRFYASGDDYVKAAKDYTGMIRSIFPQAKIGVVISSSYYTQESFLPDDETYSKGRHADWVTALRNQDFYDAVIIHTYSNTGMDNKVSKADFLPYHEAYMHAISHADAKLKAALEIVSDHFPDKEIWVTEYGIGGFGGGLRSYRLRYSYAGMLHSSLMLLKFLSMPQVEISSWHSFIQFLSYPPQKTITDETVFKTKNGYELFRLIGHAVRQSNQYIPVLLEGVNTYPGHGTNKGSFQELEAGCFFNEDNKTAYLVLVNKTAGTYDLGTILGTPNNKSGSVHLDSGIMLMPRQDIVLEKAIEDEDVMSKKVITANDVEKIEIKPYSLTSIKIRVAE
jgi:hypothetical protein